MTLAEVISHWRLIHDIGDHAIQLRAKLVVLFLIGKAAGLEQADKGALAVTAARHIVLCAQKQNKQINKARCRVWVSD